MAIARLSSKSQIVVPVSIRRGLELEPGDQVVMEIEGDHAVLRKKPAAPLDELLALIDPAGFEGAMDEVERSRDEWERSSS
jgi:antitoxin PrlF